MEIRAAVDADGAAIAELLSAHLATTTNAWTDVPHTAESALAWVRDRETVLVARDDGDVVGLAAYGWFRGAGKSGYRFTVENTVHVRESHWRAGLGRTLMETLIAEAQAARKHRMIAAIDSANERSIAFHERMGFVHVARLPEIGAKHGRWLDLVLMSLALDDRPAP